MLDTYLLWITVFSVVYTAWYTLRSKFTSMQFCVHKFAVPSKNIVCANISAVTCTRLNV